MRRGLIGGTVAAIGVVASMVSLTYWERNDNGALERKLTAADCEEFVLPSSDGEVNSHMDTAGGVLTLSGFDPALGEDRHFTFPFRAAACRDNPSLAPHVKEAEEIARQMAPRIGETRRSVPTLPVASAVRSAEAPSVPAK